jgi:hypothetical protein
MAVVAKDPYNRTWTVRRHWWPFPNVFDLVDLAFFGWVGIVIALPFLLLWPPWFLGKFLGARWLITVERSGVELDRELVRGLRRSSRRMNEIAWKIANGELSGHYQI